MSVEPGPAPELHNERPELFENTSLDEWATELMSSTDGECLRTPDSVLGSTMQAIRGGRLVELVRRKPEVLDWAVGVCLSLIGAGTDDAAAAASSIKAMLSDEEISYIVDEAVVVRRLSRIIVSTKLPAALSFAVDTLWSLALEDATRPSDAEPSPAGSSHVSSRSTLQLAFTRLMDVATGGEGSDLARVAVSSLCHALEKQPSALELLVSLPDKLPGLVGGLVRILRANPDARAGEHALMLLSRLLCDVPDPEQQQEVLNKARPVAIGAGFLAAAAHVLLGPFTGNEDAVQQSVCAPEASTPSALGQASVNTAGPDKAYMALCCLHAFLHQLIPFARRVEAAQGSCYGEGDCDPDVAADHPEAASVALALIELLQPDRESPYSGEALRLLELLMRMTQSASVHKAAVDDLLRPDRGPQRQALLRSFNGPLTAAEVTRNPGFAARELDICKELLLGVGTGGAAELEAHAPNAVQAAIAAAPGDVMGASSPAGALANAAVGLLMALAEQHLGDSTSPGAAPCANTRFPSLLPTLARVLLARAAASATTQQGARLAAAGPGGLRELRCLARCWEALVPRPSAEELQQLAACVSRGLAAMPADTGSTDTLLRLSALVVGQGVDSIHDAAGFFREAAAGCLAPLAASALHAHIALDPVAGMEQLRNLAHLLTAASQLGEYSSKYSYGGGLHASPGMEPALREALTRGCAHAVQLLAGPAGTEGGASAW